VAVGEVVGLAQTGEPTVVAEALGPAVEPSLVSSRSAVADPMPVVEDVITALAVRASIRHANGA
jgi:hypothetical protein